MAFSFHARFDVEQVYHNSFLKHAWGQQEIPYWFPLQADAEFNVSLQSDNQGFKVLVLPVLKVTMGQRCGGKNIMVYFQHLLFIILIRFLEFVIQDNSLKTMYISNLLQLRDVTLRRLCCDLRKIKLFPCLCRLM